MDANGLKFWLLADGRHWAPAGDPPDLEYDGGRRALRLSRERRELELIENRSQAEDRLNRVRECRDLYGNRAWFEAGPPRRIVASGVFDTPQEIYRLTASGELTDLTVAEDGVLYLAVGGAVLMHDLRQRWDDALVTAAGFTAWRLAAAVGGGVWALDRENRRLARLSGYPISDRAYKPYTAEVARPCHENRHPPRLTILERAAWPEAETPLALASSLTGELVVLGWVSDQDAVLRQLTADGVLGPPMTLIGSRYPYSLAWVGDGLAGVLVCGADAEGEPKSEARAYQVAAGADRQYPSGDLYPLKKDYDLGPFSHGLDYPPHYPTFTASRALHRLSFPFYTRQGEAANAALFAPLDSGAADTVWHRLYLEAAIPAACGIRIFLTAANEVLDPVGIKEADWFEHRFGEHFRQGGPADIPVGCWLPLASEIPYHPGLSPCGSESNRTGLFTALIQRPGRRVRALRGRYLQVRTELTGPGNATPELFALRAYAGRFSYVEHYLPKLYWERLFAPEADDLGPATPADFLERYVDNFEGMLTMVEDRVAASDLVTRPQSAPNAALPWLASWVGLRFEPALPEARQRAWLAHSAELAQWHGTLRGLQLALELATNGGVSGGEIVVLEDFRLRRTFATIIGAQLDDADDPLTLGGMESGNSLVGDTLFIGDEQRREFLALFSADLAVSDAEEAAIDAFFDRLAFRVTILVHQNVSPQDLGLITRVAEREAPAHVALRILPASWPLLVGITALVGVDTYLSPKPRPRPARINTSQIGGGDYVMGPATLDPRLEGTAGGPPESPSPPPVARAADVTAAYGEQFTVDGSGSTAAQGRTLTAYQWTLFTKGDS